jgi:hypothetical protein
MASLTAALKLASGTLSAVASSSPNLVHAATVAAMGTDPGRSAAPITTFRLGAGESLSDTKVSRGKGKLVGGLVALAVGGAAIFLFAGGKSDKAAPKPVAAASVAAPTPAPAPKPAPPPALPAKVTVRLASEPAGAKVFSEGNEVLGTTPFALTRPRGGSLKVRLEKDGYAAAAREVPLDEDQALEFALEKKPEPAAKPKAHKPHPSGGGDTGPAKL